MLEIDYFESRLCVLIDFSVRALLLIVTDSADVQDHYEFN